eukprot:Platyproteum_vivax@DN12535_c0_g1_i1.p1
MIQWPRGLVRSLWARRTGSQPRSMFCTQPVCRPPKMYIVDGDPAVGKTETAQRYLASHPECVAVLADQLGSMEKFWSVWMAKYHNTCQSLLSVHANLQFTTPNVQYSDRGNISPFIYALTGDVKKTQCSNWEIHHLLVHVCTRLYTNNAVNFFVLWDCEDCLLKMSRVRPELDLHTHRVAHRLFERFCLAYFHPHHQFVDEYFDVEQTVELPPGDDHLKVVRAHISHDHLLYTLGHLTETDLTKILNRF